MCRGPATALATLFILYPLVGHFALGAGLVGNARWRHWVEVSLGIANSSPFVVWLATTPVASAAGLFVAGFGTGSLHPLGLASALDRGGHAELAAGARRRSRSASRSWRCPPPPGAVAPASSLVIGLCLAAFALRLPSAS